MKATSAWLSPLLINAGPVKVTLRQRGAPRKVTPAMLAQMRAWDGAITRAEICRRLALDHDAVFRCLGRRA